MSVCKECFRYCWCYDCTHRISEECKFIDCGECIEFNNQATKCSKYVKKNEIRS